MESIRDTITGLNIYLHVLSVDYSQWYKYAEILEVNLFALYLVIPE